MTEASHGSDPAFSTGQMMTVFRSRRRDQAETEYRRLVGEMEAAARATEGFVDFKTFTAEDGERVSLVTFATTAAQQAWRDDPRHRRAQQQGRDDFYLWYSVQVGECSQVSQWERPAD